MIAAPTLPARPALPPSPAIRERVRPPGERLGDAYEPAAITFAGCVICRRRFCGELRDGGGSAVGGGVAAAGEMAGARVGLSRRGEGTWSWDRVLWGAPEPGVTDGGLARAACSSAMAYAHIMHFSSPYSVLCIS